MSKDSDSDSKWPKRRKLFCYISACFVAHIIILHLIILIIYFALRPSKPEFHLQNLILIKLDFSPGSAAPPSLTITLQVTIYSRNPNSRVGIYYDKLDTYVSYRDNPITVPVSLPSVYEGHKDVAVWSPVLYGSSVPVKADVADAIMQGQAAGLLLLHVKVEGRVRWRRGSWTTGHHHLSVNCPVFVSVNDGDGGGSVPGDGLSRIADCIVDD